MKLSRFLDINKITYEAFAKTTGYSVFAVAKWARGQRLPRPEAMRKIATATFGAVTANDFNDVADATTKPAEAA